MMLSDFLRKTGSGYSHWCPACAELHMIPRGWDYDHNPQSPTFTPSVKITGKLRVLDDKGNWLGDWHRGADGKPVDWCCHYNLSAGYLQFHGDSTHAFAGKTVPLPALPPWLR